MIVHVFPQEKFTIAFIKFINNNFNSKNHRFIIYGKHNAYNKVEVDQFANITYINDKKDVRLFINYINRGDKIILHSLFLFRWMMTYLLINKEVCKKCSWVIWGHDLYSYKIRKTTLELKAIELMKKILVKRFKYIITLSKNDYELAREWYSVEGTYKKGMYTSPMDFDYLKDIKSNRIINKRVVNIQIGNSADVSNLHFEVIEILRRFRKENIRIYVPLSYGNSEYALKVKEYGEKIFGDKFVAMLDFLDKDEYGEFLGKIDIAIFNNNRQQALGNIRALSYLGSKIYMRDDTTMWDDFISDGYHITQISDLVSENFEQFTLVSDENIALNSKLAEDTFNENRIAESWTDIFND